MDQKQLSEWFADVAPTVLFSEPLALHTTWRIGGPADVLVQPETVAQAREAVLRATAHGLPWFVLGRGSNLLVRDGGIRGLVIKLGDAFNEVRVDGERLTALSGRSMVSAANIAIRQGLSGLQFATGIPGTVGGAVAMNAGAHGSEVKDVLEQASVLLPDGQTKEWTVADFQYGYRRSAVMERQAVVLSATFRLSRANADELQSQVQEWRERRHRTQPLSLPSCGSVFRNPEGDFAARLIEAAGLKGLRVGNAAVSDLHANFIVNLGQARASDVLAVIDRVRSEVRSRFGVTLAPEVRVVGEDESRG